MNIRFVLYLLFLFLPIESKNQQHIKNTTLWSKIKRHEVDVNLLSANERIFYSLYCVKENINVVENLEYLLLREKQIPLNVFFLRKVLEERVSMLKDGEKKNQFIKALLQNYHYYKQQYSAITRDFKMIIILEFFRKKYIFMYNTYKCAYDFLQNLAYSNQNLPFHIVKQLYNLYTIDLEKRFVFLISKNSIKSAIDTAFLSNNRIFIEVVKRIVFFHRTHKRPQVFLNIFELHWYLTNFYETASCEDLANLIIENKHLLQQIPDQYQPLKINIMKIIGKIFPTLLLQEYKKLEILLDNDMVNYDEPSIHIFNYIRGLYVFFRKNYQEALSYFSKALAKHTSVKERAQYGFWVGNALYALGKKEESLQVYTKTAKLNVSYYSNMSYVILGQKPPMKAICDLHVERDVNPYDWYFTALKEVANAKDFFFAFSLIQSICLESLMIVSDSMMTMLQTLKNMNDPSYLTLLTEMIYENTGLILKDGFPMLSYFHKYSLNMSILASAILRRESFLRLECDLKSKVGAKGLMQVMPSTAKTFCQRNNIQYCHTNLQKDHHFNINLGIKCIKELLYLFKSSLFLVIPSYNVGSVKVQAWWKFYKQFLNKDNFLDMLLFIELIPATVTRLYSKEVFNNFIIFWMIHNQTLLTTNILLNMNVE